MLDSRFTSSLVAKIYLTCTILELNVADNGQKQEKRVRTSISDHLQTPNSRGTQKYRTIYSCEQTGMSCL